MSSQNAPLRKRIHAEAQEHMRKVRAKCLREFKNNSKK
jgi:hypothetical protein